MSETAKHDQENHQSGSLVLAHKKFALSGVPAGESGAERFFKVFSETARENGFLCLSPKSGNTFSDTDRNFLKNIKNSKIIILHPQRLGHSLINDLYKNNNQLLFYVLDSSFFCIQSYNHVPGEYNACLRCLKNPRNVLSSCNSSPEYYPKQENTDFLLELMRISKDIRFYCQNQNQEKLIKAHFGDNVFSLVVGMTTNECQEDPNAIATPARTFDVVLHATPIPAKGVIFALILAHASPQINFLFPFEPKEMFTHIGQVNLPPNISFEPMSWETGLKNHVTHAKLVLNPSLWSAPIEGALIKSLYYNGNVATVDCDYSFQKEVPDEFICRLPSDPMIAASMLASKLSSTNSRRQAVRQWITDFNKKVDLNKIFQSELTFEQESFH